MLLMFLNFFRGGEKTKLWKPSPKLHTTGKESEHLTACTRHAGKYKYFYLCLGN